MNNFYLNNKLFNSYLFSSMKFQCNNSFKIKIGVLEIFKKISKNRNFILNVDLDKRLKIDDKSDIIEVESDLKTRKANIFIRIKSSSSRWIGLTEEQFNTIKRSAGNKDIFMIYASLRSNTLNDNPKTTDLTGMFLKEIEDKTKSDIFQKFADLNAECKIEFIISSKDLEKFSYPFEKGMNMYETNLFIEKKSRNFYSKEGTRKDVLDIKEYKNFNETFKLEIEKGFYPEKEEISNFKVKGNFKIIHKRKKSFIECVSNVEIENDIFGKFFLENGKFYSFNLATVGRDPKLKRNNLFIAKNRIYQLIEKGEIRKPEVIVKEIVKNI